MEVANPVFEHLRSRLITKTRTLSRLRETTKAFAQAFSLEELPAFEQKRERLLKLLGLLDRSLAKDVSRLTQAERLDPALLSMIREESAAQEREIHAILGEDETILTAVRAAQVELAREIARTSKQGQDLTRFKSEWVARSGEGIDSHA